MRQGGISMVTRKLSIEVTKEHIDAILDLSCCDKDLYYIEQEADCGYDVVVEDGGEIYDWNIDDVVSINQEIDRYYDGREDREELSVLFVITIKKR